MKISNKIQDTKVLPRLSDLLIWFLNRMMATENVVILHHVYAVCAPEGRDGLRLPVDVSNLARDQVC